MANGTQNEMQGGNGEGWKGRNHLLRQLDAESAKRWRPFLKLVTLEPQQVLYHPDQHISEIYFPETAVLCMLTIMENGHTIESATVGSEGASWISASLGEPTMPCQTMASLGGTAYVISARHVEDESRRNGIFHNVLVEYSHALLISSLRTGACNALHSVTQRCARWLLTALDRTADGHFGITHEFLASLLGCNRPALTHILGELEQAGGIHNRRGVVEVIHRQSLETSACECYRILYANFEAMRHREHKVGSTNSPVRS